MKNIKIKKTYMACLSVMFFLGATVAQSNAATSLVNKIPANYKDLPEFTTSVISKIKNTNKIIIGYRESSIPISYAVDLSQNPIGYGVDVCNNIIEKIKQTYNLPNLNVEYQLVDSSSRVPMVAKGLVDLECSSTTNNAGRRKEVAFGLTYILAGARILTRTEEKINSLNDLKNKRVVFAKGTSQEALMKRLNEERKMNIKLTEAPSFTVAVQNVYNNEADAFILDDTLLFGERSKVADPEKLKVVGDYLSFEPGGIMMSKHDSELQNLVNKQIVEMTNSGQLEKLYTKWFLSPIAPSLKSLDLPQSVFYRDLLRMPTDKVGN